jgi:hypothetical protein
MIGSSQSDDKPGIALTVWVFAESWEDEFQRLSILAIVLAGVGSVVFLKTWVVRLFVKLEKAGMRRRPTAQAFGIIFAVVGYSYAYSR